MKTKSMIPAFAICFLLGTAMLAIPLAYPRKRTQPPCPETESKSTLQPCSTPSAGRPAASVRS